MSDNEHQMHATPLSEETARAISCASENDAPGFREAVLALSHADDFASQSEIVASRFVAEVERIAGPTPTVNEIVLLSQALWPQVSQVMDLTPFDIEFLVRGFAGAETLMRAIPREIAVAIMLASLGALPRLEASP